MPWAKATREANCHHTQSLCTLARRSTRKSTQFLQSTSRSFLRSAQRGARRCRLRRKEKLKTWQRWTRPNIKRNENYMPPIWETKKKFKNPSAPKGLLQPFSCFVLSISQKSKESLLAYPLVMLQRSWDRWGMTLLQVTSSLIERRKNMEMILLHTELKERLMWQKWGL